MPQRKYKYLFGPVPSRRLGRSLGVDIIPLKTCTQNCIYCQLGKDALQTLERKEYAPIDAVLDELKTKVADGLEADFITISGSGEPTLHCGLGKLTDGIRRITDIPVAVITNGTLLFRADVRDDCCKADVVLPSLDAGDANTFQKMNHPHPELDFEQYVDGLVRFRSQYTGQIWLEVFICEGVNTTEQAISNLKTRIAKIKPDKIQVNTSVRPVVHAEAARVEPERLEQIAHALSERAEVIADFSKHTGTTGRTADLNVILETLRRRPCSLEDLSAGLGLSKEQLIPALTKLQALSRITTEEKNKKIYYKPL
jgi:wyosine [tRNA(Phe)-imidazoG37] synthetase (radical SAM superfamily)